MRGLYDINQCTNRSCKSLKEFTMVCRIRDMVATRDEIITNMKHKPGDLYKKFQKNKKSYSESDMGNIKAGGYDPNLGRGKAGMKAMQSVKKVPTPKMSSSAKIFNGKGRVPG